MRSVLAVAFVALVAIIPLCQGEASEETIRKMKVKELRAFLDARGVVCEGCVEKRHWVNEAIKSRLLPEIQKPPEPEPEPSTSEPEAGGAEEQAEEVKEEKQEESAGPEDKKAEEGKKADEKGGDFGTVWGRQAHKICSKATAKGGELEVWSCDVIRDEITRSFNQMNGITMMSSGMNGMGDLADIISGKGKGAQSHRAKIRSLKSPYKEAGLKAVKSLVKEAAKTAREWAPGLPLKEADEVKKPKVEAEEKKEGEESTSTPEGEVEVKSLESTIKSLVSNHTFSWMFDVILKDSGMGGYGGGGGGSRAQKPKKPSESSKKSSKKAPPPKPKPPPKAPVEEEIEEEVEETIDLDGKEEL